MSRPLATVLFAALVATTALAGCFQANPQSEEASYSISRSFSVLINAETSQQMEGVDGPEDAIRRLVDASLVIRVGEPGDYALTYTDEDGRTRTESLTGLAPGTARTVEGVDPFTAAMLARGGTTLASRGPITQEWWRIGDMPLGVRASSPASASYDYEAYSSLELQLEDITSEDGNLSLDTLLARLSMPLDGEITWSLAPEGAEDRLEVKGAIEVDDTRGSLVLIDAAGVFEGEPVTAGMEVVSGSASADGSFAVFLKGGEVVAGQFLGGAARAAPKVYVWATGVPEEEQETFSCANKAREDRCEPDELEPVDESEPAGARDDVPTGEFDAETEEEKEALRLLQKLFAQDLGVHDSFTLTAEVDDEDVGDEASEYSARFVQEISVAAQESIQVPAGTFDAFRVVQSARIVVDADRIEQSECETYGGYPDYGCASWNNGTVVEDLTLDETLLRTTLWLDSTTFQPLKGEVLAPIDLGVVVRRTLNAMGDAFWSEVDLAAFDPNKLQLTANSESSFVARSLAGDTRFAPYVGLMLGSMMTGGLGPATAPSMVAPFGMRSGFEQPPMAVYPTMEPYPYPTTPYPTYPTYPYPYPTPTSYAPPTPEQRVASLGLTSAGPITDGAKTYIVESASEGLTWGDLALSVDGFYRSMAHDTDCAAGLDYEFVVCNEGTPKEHTDLVLAGDAVRLPVVESGQTLRVIDQWSNTVILSLNID